MPNADDPPANDAPGLKTYTESVASGFYNRHLGGLSGKHDNVRTYWEDPLTRIFLRPHIDRISSQCRKANRGVRILDLGCGAGQGYELLTRIEQKDLNLDEEPRFVLPASEIERYLGLDISYDMVEQGRQNFGGTANVDFEQADLSREISVLKSEPAFDIYFSSYGPLSHLDTPSMTRCLGDIVRHARSGALIVMDLLGRYSPEWPVHWESTNDDPMLLYSMSYLHEGEDRQNGEVEQFPMRTWTGDEVHELCREIGGQNGVSLNVVASLDRSMFVGRHIDTREYGSDLPRLRNMVNHLLELNVRTKLDRLRVDYRPNGNDELDRYFGELAMCWTEVVDFTLERVQGNRIDLVALDGWRYFPPQLQTVLMTMDRVIDSVAWIDQGDVRANILEPQLAYAFRRLEYTMQRGQGYGHGLVSILQVE
jgi:SAM-dependent methyltransferase